MTLETSTPRGGVALFRGEEMVFSHSFTADRSHSSELFAVVERALAPDLHPDCIAVGLGPGSYAGVRIAIAAAIGLSVATGAELIGLPSVVALDDGEYLALGDARRGAYAFTHVRDGEILAGPMLRTREEIEARLGTLPAYSSEELGLPGVEIRFPCVDRLARLAVAGRSITGRGALEPIYLREPHITSPKARGAG
ncbi:MAG TPA: tRNA (adenosine(37)-N6)-threonylcarbamoyltransferase complex dimerization subunit type 1 TsaB [Chthoniobacteraceae bacterium]|nr:tRNA (adenosine(37)-N6)-threonylcarbamoyltransferase complex dimerization subunit type 1 TsaB [Chthoniobacteraceae bacterium]